MRTRWYEIAGLIQVQWQGLSGHITIFLALLSSRGRRGVQEELENQLVAMVQPSQSPLAPADAPLCGERTLPEKKVTFQVKESVNLLASGIGTIVIGIAETTELYLLL